MQLSKNLVALSKRLSYVLRHRPDSIGVTLAPDGWVPIETLLWALSAHGTRVTREQLDAIVAGNNKQRFAIDGERIRASQGHSVSVELGLQPVPPPEVLYHGTARRHLSSIYAQGIVRGRRHHVHLSAEPETAQAVGARHGQPAVLTVATAEMAAVGHVFYRSDNGVWLTDEAPPQFLLATACRKTGNKRGTLHIWTPRSQDCQ